MYQIKELKKKLFLKYPLLNYYYIYAVVAELVDARVLGTRIFWCGSSSLPDRISSKLIKGN